MGGGGSTLAGGGGGKLGAGGVWDLDPGRPLKNCSKTAQILLEKPFKNHARNERFLSGFFSKN